MTEQSYVRAVLDVGSNTIRLLVGRVIDGAVVQLLDDSEFVRLGKDVDRSGELRGDRVAAALEAIERLAGEAKSAGAGTVLAFATSAVRDARNGTEFVEEVQRRTGIEIDIISGEREAELTFRGATIGINLSGGAVVCDLGGGSAELLFAGADGIKWSTSQPLGSGRLTERFIRHDPPRPQELRSLRTHVHDVLTLLPDAKPECAIFTGGTATHLTVLMDRQSVVSRFSPDELGQALDMLSGRTAEEVAREYQFRPERAAVLPAGIAALQAVARYYEVTTVVVTRRGIREGALLDAE